VPAAADHVTPEYLEIRLSGSGGQGIILAATLLGDACAQAGRHVVQTQSYGPEARGGASKAEVIVSTHEVDFPEVRRPDVTLCLSQQAFDTYADQTRADGLVLTDTGLVRCDGLGGRVRLAGACFTEIATTQLGKAVATNVVALGALLALTGLAPPEAVQKALRRRLPAKIVELNLRALELGAEAMEADPTAAAPAQPS
jgi:2-oxoglutarate ferredoxin oxidoreductase subunit gamma